MKKKFELLMAVVVLLAAILFARGGAILVGNLSVKDVNQCIVIDAGHGGFDPGKVGVNGTEEKTVNLAIAKNLEKLLKKDGFKVVMTRSDDTGLYQENSNNKKVEDMRNRCEIITEEEPVFTVSIHQNSFPQENVKGAQVFYYGQSAEGNKLADILQSNLVSQLDPDNHRVAKANESYYMLKRTPTPTVIVECGFLSNAKEAALLIDSDYQKKVAAAIHKGIMEYLKK